MSALAFALAATLAVSQAPDRVADVRVQGNTLTPDAEVVALTEVAPGDPFTPQLIADAKARLEKSGKFRRVEVLQRFASISDPSAILLVVIVDEGRVGIRTSDDGLSPRAVRRRGPPLMLLPLFGSAEGYGFTYGALLSFPNVAGRGTRLTFPLTWGGERRAEAEYEKRFSTARPTRLLVAASGLQRRNDAEDSLDRRAQFWVRGEREVARALRLGVWSGVDSVNFGGTHERLVRLGVDAAVDTRVDPMLSRNAIYVRSAFERLAVRGGKAPLRTLVDANVYVGGPLASIVAVRVYRDGSNEPVPAFLRVLRGRDSTLRGFRAGTASGDTTAAGTLEVRVPVNSPLSLGKLGVRAFIDAATVYDTGQRLTDQHFQRGVGGGVWFTATVIRLAVDVAHGSEGQTRVQLTSGLLF